MCVCVWGGVGGAGGGGGRVVKVCSDECNGGKCPGWVICPEGKLGVSVW